MSMLFWLWKRGIKPEPFPFPNLWKAGTWTDVAGCHCFHIITSLTTFPSQLLIITVIATVWLICSLVEWENHTRQFRGCVLHPQLPLHRSGRNSDSLKVKYRFRKLGNSLVMVCDALITVSHDGVKVVGLWKSQSSWEPFLQSGIQVRRTLNCSIWSQGCVQGRLRPRCEEV